MPPAAPPTPGSEPVLYDVTVTTPGARFRLPRVADAETMCAYVADAFAAWGIPVPPVVQDPAALAAKLATRGAYTFTGPRTTIRVCRAKEGA
jgi:hypothetical protein